MDLPDLGKDIDMETFSQILEMDEHGDREFSHSIVFGFFEQAEEAFQEMEEALEAHNLEKLRTLGHFLKGSSATIGLTLVKDSCEVIQRYGAKENLDGTPENDEEKCLRRIRERFEQLKVEYYDAESVLRKFYEEDEI